MMALIEKPKWHDSCIARNARLNGPDHHLPGVESGKNAMQANQVGNAKQIPQGLHHVYTEGHV